MKLMTLSIAGLVAATTLVPSVASAHPRDRWDDRRGWNDHRGRDDHRGWNDRRGWRGDRGWRDNRYAWNGYRGGPRARTVCQWVDGYYGPQRRCFRVRR